MRSVVFRGVGRIRATCFLLSRKKQNKLCHALHGNPLFGLWAARGGECPSRKVASLPQLHVSETDVAPALEFVSGRNEDVDVGPGSRVSDAPLERPSSSAAVSDVPLSEVRVEDIPSILFPGCGSPFPQSSASSLPEDKTRQEKQSRREERQKGDRQIDRRTDGERARDSSPAFSSSVSSASSSSGRVNSSSSSCSSSSLLPPSSSLPPSVWVLTKEGKRGKAVVCVSKGQVFRAARRAGEPLQTWVCYGDTELEVVSWETLGDTALWRLRGRGDGEDAPPVWSSQGFAVKKRSPPAYVLSAMKAKAKEEEFGEYSPGKKTGRESGKNRGTNQERAAADFDRINGKVGEQEENEDAEGDHCSWFPEGMTWEWIATASIFPIKRIPKGVRLLWADTLVKVLRGILNTPSDDRRWRLLFALPKLCLRLPKRGGRKKRKVFEATPFIAEKLRRALAGDWMSLWEETSESGKRKKRETASDGSMFGVRERVVSLVEEGQFTKAVQALNSAGIFKLDEDIIEKLKAKHPIGKGLTETEAAAEESAQFDIEEVKAAISSFGRTAPGGSRFRASYLQDALSVPAGDSEERLSSALTGVVNLLASGAAPEESAVWIAGAPPFSPAQKRWRCAACCGRGSFAEVGSQMFLCQIEGQKREALC